MNKYEDDFMLLWDYNNPAETQKKFLEISEKYRNLKDKGRYIELLTQIARTNSLQKKFDEAHKILDEANILLTDEYNTATIRYYLERGRTYNSSGEYKKAEECFHNAYKISTENNEDDLAIDAAHMLGIVYKGEESLKWNKRAIEMAEISKDENAKRWLGSLYNNTGWTYFDIGDYENALQLFEKNIVFHKEKNSKQELIIAIYCAAKTIRAIGRVNEALEIMLKLAKQNEEFGLSEDGYIYKEIGECYFDLNQQFEAKKYFKKAYDILINDIWFDETEKQRLKQIIYQD